MTLHAWYEPDSGTYIISNGREELAGVPRDEYRQFVNDIRDGIYNPSALIMQAKARRQSVSA